MRLRHSGLFFGVLGTVLLLTFCIGVQGALSGNLRINMTDGTSVEVPYYWEEAGQLKFETPGGVAGIPKNQVASIREVLAAKEFDPQALVEQPAESTSTDNGTSGGNNQKALQDLALNKTPLNPAYTRLGPEESARLLEMAAEARRDSVSTKEKIYGPAMDLKGDFAELVRSEGNGVVLLIRNIISSRTDLGSQAFDITLFDAEGDVLLRKPCEVQQLDVDQKMMRKLNLTGHVFAVSAAVTPDPKIKRYEITVAQR